VRTTDEAGPTKGYLTGLLPDLVGRVRVPELMDDPDLDRDLHEAALDALTRINKVSGVAGRVWHEARELHAETGAPVRIFDVACGRGDVLMAVAMRAKGAGVPVSLGATLARMRLNRRRRLSTNVAFLVPFLFLTRLAIRSRRTTISLPVHCFSIIWTSPMRSSCYA
jgi:hypothetical protein